MKALTIALAVALVGSTACRSDTVRLQYRFPGGGELSYRLEANADAEWNIGETGRGSYHVVFRVTESVVETDGNEAVVEVTMTPLRVRESGLPSPGSEERSFTLRVDTTGSVVDVIEVQGVPAQQLDPAQVAFIGTYRPALPAEPQRLKDAWTDVRSLSSESVSERMTTRGRLQALDRDDLGELAELRFTGRGPLLYATELLQGQAELQGTSFTEIDADLDLAGGYLRSARSTIDGDFDVTVLPVEGADPLRGDLHLHLELKLDRLEAG
jgi:hypothetical protein